MADLEPATPLNGEECWSFVEAGITDVLAASINYGLYLPGQSLPWHVDTVEVTDAYPFEEHVPRGKDADFDKPEKVVLSGIRLGAVAVNGDRAPFTIFIPSAIREGVPFKVFDERQMAHIREIAARRQVAIIYS